MLLLSISKTVLRHPKRYPANIHTSLTLPVLLAVIQSIFISPHFHFGYNKLQFGYLLKAMLMEFYLSKIK